MAVIISLSESTSPLMRSCLSSAFSISSGAAPRSAFTLGSAAGTYSMPAGRRSPSWTSAARYTSICMLSPYSTSPSLKSLPPVL